MYSTCYSGVRSIMRLGQSSIQPTLHVMPIGRWIPKPVVKLSKERCGKYSQLAKKPRVQRAIFPTTTYLLLKEFKDCTLIYKPSLFHLELWPKCKVKLYLFHHYYRVIVESKEKEETMEKEELR